MIEDIEGATADRSRHGHVLALSAAGAAVSLILLIALVLPPSDVGGPRSAAASPGAGAFAMTFARGDTRVSLTQVFSRDGTALVGCFANVDGSWGPSIAVRPDRRGPVVSVGPETSMARSVPVPVAAPRTGWRSVNCATSDVFAPREMFAR